MVAGFADLTAKQPLEWEATDSTNLDQSVRLAQEYCTVLAFYESVSENYLPHALKCVCVIRNHANCTTLITKKKTHMCIREV